MSTLQATIKSSEHRLQEINQLFLEAHCIKLTVSSQLDKQEKSASDMLGTFSTIKDRINRLPSTSQTNKLMEDLSNGTKLKAICKTYVEETAPGMLASLIKLSIKILQTRQSVFEMDIRTKQTDFFSSLNTKFAEKNSKLDAWTQSLNVAPVASVLYQSKAPTMNQSRQRNALVYDAEEIVLDPQTDKATDAEKNVLETQTEMGADTGTHSHRDDSKRPTFDF
jgi:hypothetical protein